MRGHIARAINLLQREDGTVQDDDVEAFAWPVVAVVVVQVIAVLAGAAPHDERVRTATSDARQIKNLAADPCQSACFDLEVTAIV